jgi:SH3-like domain-containing protein
MPIEKMLCCTTLRPIEIDDDFFDPRAWQGLGQAEMLCRMDDALLRTPFEPLVSSFRATLNALSSQSMPPTQATRLAIVVFGCKLKEDGSCADALLSRMRCALKTMRLYKNVILIVSGGNPRFGITESQAMQNWFIEHGVPIEQIVQEDQSCDTLENIQNAVPLLQSLEHDHTILVTSAWHMQRALGLFMRSQEQRGVVASVSFVSSLEARPAGSSWANEACLLWKDLGRMAALWQYPPRI